MSYFGDVRLGKTLDIKFSTINSAGVPTTLGGSPVISAYPDNSTTEITAGITLTTDLDSRTGLNNVRVVATSGNGYATATNYTLVITTGTVDGTSVVGYVVGSFSIEARSALMPTTADRTAAIDASGRVDLGLINGVAAAAVLQAYLAQGGVSGTAVTGTLSSTQMTTDLTETTDDHYKDRSLVWITGALAGMTVTVTAYLGSTKRFTYSTTPTGEAPSNGDRFIIV